MNYKLMMHQNENELVLCHDIFIYNLCRFDILYHNHVKTNFGNYCSFTGGIGGRKYFVKKITHHRKIVERGNIDNTQIHDHSLSLLGTGTSIKSGGLWLS
jgi:hypothetical protein